MNKKIFLFGCFGGMAPSIIKVARILLAAFEPDFQLPGATTFLCAGFAAVLLGLVGGIVVCAMEEKKYGKAIFLGVSAPSLILAALQPTDAQKNVDQKSKEHAEISWNLNLFVTSAYAQPASPKQAFNSNKTKDVSQPGARSVEVYSLNKTQNFNIVFYSASGDILGTQVLAPDSKTRVLASMDASYVRFSAADSLSDNYQLPKDSTMVADYQVKVTFEEKYTLLGFFTQTPKIIAHFEVNPITRKKIEPGKEGWMYLGMYVAGEWLPDKRHTILVEAPANAVGTTTTVAYENTHFRSSMPTKVSNSNDTNLPTISLGQHVNVLEVKQSDNVANAWWARIKIID
jgi:hypothetical protein